MAAWPLAAQVVGSLVACASVGVLAGAAWGFLSGGLAMVVAGIVNEPQPVPSPKAPTK